jgi:ABC-type sugar transport system ATPase subunit
MCLDHDHDQGRARCAVRPITHIMRHIHPLADRFVVLWQGRKIADIDKGKLTIRELEELVIRGRLETLAAAPW